MKGLEFVSNSPQLLTLGIKPNRPETGYGYIQIEEEKQGEFFKVKTIIEKPQTWEICQSIRRKWRILLELRNILMEYQYNFRSLNEIMPEVVPN